MQIDQAQDDKVLNRILDDPAHMAIINSSTWPITKGISMLTKMELMQTLIIEEVITKRDVNIRAFRTGLFVLGFLNLCRDYADLMKPLFVHCEEYFTREKFQFDGCSSPSRPCNHSRCSQSFQLLREVCQGERGSLIELVSTCPLQHHPTSHVKN